MESILVKDYMNKKPVSFSPNMSIEEAALKFLETKQIGGPVVDKQGRLVGFLSESDVLKKLLEATYYNEHVVVVSDIMRTDVLSVKPYSSVVELAQVMLMPKPKVYPVVDDDENLLGTICRNDVLKALDAQLKQSFHA